ncbi:MAG: hypothetical protein IKW76_08385, partial [Clostridia bacterium]|nr:hypothetical protein [Clostridia bacterium]
MIKQLRKKFIRISIAAVAAVMVLLCASVNIVYFLSVNAHLNETLDMIAGNQGRMPEFKGMRRGMPGEAGEPRPMPRQFNEETPFATRFFVLQYSEDGKLIHADLAHIAAVTDSDVQD